MGNRVHTGVVYKKPAVSKPPVSNPSVNNLVPEKQSVPNSIMEHQSDNIAIIDTFDSGEPIFMTRDKNIYHGEVIERFIHEGLPDAHIEEFNVNGSNTKINQSGIIDSLKEILKRTEKGEKFSAVNCSMAAKLNYFNISVLSGKQITPDNLSENREKVLEYIRQQQDPAAQADVQIIDLIEKIVSKGVPVYVGAGNSKSTFNILSLAKGVNTVGALDIDGTQIDEFSNNSLVNKKGQGFFYVLKTMNPENYNVGFDYTDDGSIDIHSSELLIPREAINGTSYSTPKAIVQDLKKKQAEKNNK